MRVVTSNGWVMIRNDFGKFTYAKVDNDRMCSISQTRDYGYVLVITCFLTGKVRKVWNLASVEDAQNIYENS